jgi:hypothetical protein
MDYVAKSLRSCAGGFLPVVAQALSLICLHFTSIAHFLATHFFKNLKKKEKDAQPSPSRV